MSTSEFGSGMPDPAVLERMANEYFKLTTAGVSSPPVSSADGQFITQLHPSVPLPYSQVPSAPYNFAPTNPQAQTVSELSLPGAISAADLETLPAALQVPSVDPLSVVSGSGLPAFPGGALAGVPDSASAFSFLQSIRPLTSTIPGLPSVDSSAEAASVSAAQGLPALPAQYPSPELTAPSSAGVPSHNSEYVESLSYGFLKEIREPLSFNAVPTLEPFGYVPDASSWISTSSAPFDVNAVRRDFPILEERINGRQLVWLDNAATTQKPLSVIDRISYFYLHENSNIHRAAHTLAARSTDAYEGARDKVAAFLHASSSKEIIFVRGATEGINLIAQTWGKKNIQKDDEIVITWLEHHANIVPWQMLCSEKGARLKVAPVDHDGQVILEEYEKLLGPRTKLVSITQVSNALGTVVPVTEMVAAAHRYGARAVVDGAQAVSHMPIDVQAIDCDFYVFSGHKVFAPTGIGVVYGKPEVLEHMPPWQGGGNMIVDVTFEKTVYHGPPGRFEAGTGSIAPAVGLGAAIDYLNGLGMHNVARYEHDLLLYAMDALKSIPGLHLIGTAKEKASVLSFVLDGFRTEDVGTALNQEGIAVRSGHHCAQPILRRFGLESTVRPSLALYNTCEEVDKLVAAIWNLKKGRTSGVI